MSEAADRDRRDSISDTLAEFERRIEERILAIDESECFDLVLNRSPTLAGESPHVPGSPIPLRYETHEEVSLLRVIRADAPNQACLNCDLFGRTHCCGGLLFLYYALRDAGEKDPLGLLAVEIEPGLYLPDWELMLDNRHRILLKARDYFEAHLARVTPEVDGREA